MIGYSENNILPVNANFDWITDEAKQILADSYLQADETPADMYSRISKKAAIYLQGTPLEDVAYAVYMQLFSKGWFSPASPVAANFGSNRGMPVSCFGLYVPNSVDGIYKSAHEAAMLSKNGGGLGVDLSSIAGQTSASIWAKLFDYTAATVSQGGIRRGAVAIYIDLDHADAMQLMQAKDLLQGDPRYKLDCNIAVNISDEFMQKLSEADEDARIKFAKVLELRMKYGSPYLFFTGNANRQRGIAYDKQNLDIKHSQLCLHGSTKILTSAGITKISELVGKTVLIWDGENWVENSAFQQTGIANRLVHVQFQKHSELLVTEYHKFYLSASEKEIRAIDLTPGDSLHTVSGKPAIVKRVQLIRANSEPVYCTKVESTGKFTLGNGIISGNCNEISLHSDENHTYNCVLSSFNLAKWREYDTLNLYGYHPFAWGIFFLDAVQQEFIYKSANRAGFERSRLAAMKGRALGLGTLGLHALFQSESTFFGDAHALALDAHIHFQLGKHASIASKQLAKWFGEPEWCKGTGLRNTHTLAIAPTTTNSALCNAGSPGIEPAANNYYTVATAKGSFIRINRFLKLKLSASELKQVRIDNGSVKNIARLTELEKKIFATFAEISPHDILKHAIVRQKAMAMYGQAQSQSLNLYIDKDMPAEKIAELHIRAYREGLLGLYYVRSNSAMLASKKPRVHMQTRQNCEWCTKAKELLESQGIEFTEENKPEGQVPQIWFDDVKLADGYNSLSDLLGKGAGANACSACEG